MSGMELRSKNAALKVARIMQKMEEYALGIGQSSTCAARRDAQNMLSKEECASSMEQKSNYAGRMDAEITPRRGEYV